MSKPIFHRSRPQPSWRFLQILTISSVALCMLLIYHATSNRIPIPALPKFGNPRPEKGNLEQHDDGQEKEDWNRILHEYQHHHPIDGLITNAQRDFASVLETQAKSLGDAAARYRRRRGRHPPPGFDAWYSFAASHNSIIVESFFDQIHDDLAPLWGMDPRTLRLHAHSLTPKIALRKGRVEPQKNNADSSGRLQNWMQMLQDIGNGSSLALPDVDMPMNINPDPGVTAPWEMIDTSLELSQSRLLRPADVLGNYAGVRELDASSETVDNHTKKYKFDPEWLDGRATHPASYLGARPYWSLVVPACHPQSPARHVRVLDDIWQPQGHTSEEHSTASMLSAAFSFSESGFVGNWTNATNLCLRPMLQGLHGSLVTPDTFSSSKKLFPYFGERKFSINNDILLPGIGEWNASVYSGGEGAPWEQKDDKLFWRGPATGGKNTKLNWQRFQRHRFVSMLNASHVRFAEASLQNSSNEGSVGVGPGGIFRLLPKNPYLLVEQKDGRLADWVGTWSDAAFTDLICDDSDDKETTPHPSKCSYNQEFFSVTSRPTLKERGKHKYAAILDGNGRDDENEFINTLKRDVVPMRASLYRKWFDSRLWPWVHYVPVDNTFVDLYGVMRYFLGGIEGAGSKRAVLPRSEQPAENHDEAARRIAQEGKKWAEKVLRREDALVYVYRLVLEYARVVDQKRERLGWVADLIKEEGDLVRNGS